MQLAKLLGKRSYGEMGESGSFREPTTDVGYP